MSARYILVECNRLRGNNAYSSINEDNDIYKNKWINNISSSGLVINTGDQLAIQDIIVNSRGASDDVMEINASVNENGFLDNKMILEHSFYINHIARNTVRMPFFYHKTYRGIGTIVDPETDISGEQLIVNAESGQAATPILPGTIDNFKQMLSRRSLGETFFPPFDIDDGTSWNPDKTYQLQTYCNGSMLLTLTTKQIGTGATGDPNSGYIVGFYTTTVTPSGGVGLTIRVDSVKEEGGIPGIVDTWSVESYGQGYSIGNTITLGARPDGGAAPATLQEYNLTSYPDLLSYQSSNVKQADGSRYYYANHDYTGLTNKMDIVAAPADPDDIDADRLISDMNKRTQKTTLEAKGGFLTPDNLATLLTDQLHEPTRITRQNDIAPYMSLEKFKFTHNVNWTEITQLDGNPVIIETPTYKAIPSNFDYTAINGNATLAGSRLGFYSGLAYKDSERFFALKECFYNFQYGANNETTTKPSNDISSGSVGSDDFVGGDYGGQTTGDLGMRVCSLNRFLDSANGLSVKAEANSPIVTNMLWTENNLKRISKAFRASEKYLGDQTKEVDVTSGNYYAYLAVNLDIGLYDDELSTQGTLTRSKNSPFAAFLNQRTKFQPVIPGMDSSTACEVPVDVGTINTGYQRDINNVENDGQQLSSIWVRSRHDDNIQYGGGNLSFDEWKTANGQQLFDTDHTADELFMGSWVDEDGVTQTTASAIQQADAYDIMAVPVFGRTNGNGRMFNAKPFIAFINAIPCDQGGVFNKDFPQNSTWNIDIKNANPGEQIGLDPSFTRNDCVASISPMLGNTDGTGVKSAYMNIQYIGAVDPSVRFDPALSRFAISNLNTQTVLSNGLLSDIPETLEASANPEQPVIKVNRNGQTVPQRQKWLGLVSGGNQLLDSIQVSQFNQAQQEEATILDSQSGIAIENLYLLDENNNETKITNQNNLNYSLFDKMGFRYNQLIPDFGGEQAFFTNAFIYQSKANTYRQQIINTIKPMTTGSYVSSAEVQSLSTNTSNQPMFDLGVEALRQAVPNITAGLLTAFNLPSKLSYPYLCVYSSIPSGGTDTHWLGGGDGQSRIPCMGILTRQNNEGDYFYGVETSYNFTATKDFTLSEVETEFRLPDGSRPKLEPHSTVIYKVTKPLVSVAQENIQASLTRGVKTDKK